MRQISLMLYIAIPPKTIKSGNSMSSTCGRSVYVEKKIKTIENGSEYRSNLGHQGECEPPKKKPLGSSRTLRQEVLLRAITQ